jgi:hypothetical protein
MGICTPRRWLEFARQALDADSDLRTSLGQLGAKRASLFSPEVYGRRIGALYRSVLG